LEIIYNVLALVQLDLLYYSYWLLNLSTIVSKYQYSRGNTLKFFASYMQSYCFNANFLRDQRVILGDLLCYFIDVDEQRNWIWT